MAERACGRRGRARAAAGRTVAGACGTDRGGANGEWDRRLQTTIVSRTGSEHARGGNSERCSDGPWAIDRRPGGGLPHEKLAEKSAGGCGTIRVLGCSLRDPPEITTVSQRTQGIEHVKARASVSSVTTSL